MGNLWKSKKNLNCGAPPLTSEASVWVADYLLCLILILISIIYNNNFFFASFFVIPFCYMYLVRGWALSLGCFLPGLFDSYSLDDLFEFPVSPFPISVFLSPWGIIAQKGRF